MSDALNFHQRNGKYINVGGTNIFTIDQGEGEVILLLHGFFGTSYSFRKIIPILSKEYRVVAPDLPGLGFSEQIKEVYSHRVLADIIYKFIEKITDEKIHLVVHDYGGPISFLMMNSHPEKVKTLTVISSFLNLTKFRFYFPLNILNKRFIGNLFGKLLSTKVLRFIFNSQFISQGSPFDESTSDDYAFLLVHGNNRSNFVKMCQCVDRTIHAQRDMELGLKKMIGGRQILVGKQNKIISPMEVEYIKQTMRLSIANYLSGKHFLMEDSAEECASKIEMLVNKFSSKDK
ncbi:MAG: alpha/beta hydrolase [Leptospiraceae bacterium]|nr:alpha/beta hydrolase [Leptospiraceae bacterium]MCP5496446.1 alpha/beta hydrolase [Leptospiraceae bacterium]